MSNRKCENILLLHIGTAKTGTTALQFFLHENQERLKEKGWCYPDFAEEAPEFLAMRVRMRVKNGVRLYGECVEDGIDITSERWNKVWKNILKLLEQYNVILSAEEMYDWSLLELLEEVKRKHTKIKVIIYLRRQDRYAESRWAQRIKGNFYSEKFCSYIKKIEYEDIFMQESLSYLHRLEQIEKIIGKSNLIVRVYEKEQFVGEERDIVSDFLSVMNIDIQYHKEQEITKANVRLSDNYTEIKRIINSLQGKESSFCTEKIREYMYELMTLFPDSYEEVGYFHEKERKVFLDKYIEQNSKIAKRYLGREDGILFCDKRMDFPLGEVRALSMEEDIIKLFGLIVFEQNRNVKEHLKYIHAKNTMLIQQFVLQSMRGRSLVYFGAGKMCKELLLKYQLPVSLIFDNSREKSGGKINGIDVRTPNKDEQWTSYFIIITCICTREIELQLKDYGLQENSDYILAKNFM